MLLFSKFLISIAHQEIAKCFNAERMSQICQVLALDYRHYRRGLPDLIVWNPTTKAVKIIEVKSHFDRVSPTQSMWLTFLSSFGFDVEICHVKPKSKSG